MVSIVDPNADSLWSSVQVTITVKGTQTKMPRTDEDWAEVRQHAITLLEATNLLLIPNRHAAKPGENAENGIEETPEAIEALINKDRPTFENRVERLRAAAKTVLAAIDKKDVPALEESSLNLDSACEACHVVYWYPKDDLSKRLFEQTENHDNNRGKH
jgi:cytochrome c556